MHIHLLLCFLFLVGDLGSAVSNILILIGLFLLPLNCALINLNSSPNNLFLFLLLKLKKRIMKHQSLYLWKVPTER